MCAALIATHSAGIVHRDIKPENLFIVHQDGLETLKLVDFGICSGPLVAQGSPRGSALYGTPAYMAPERLCDDTTADHRADIWAIGVVLHELVTGRGLFEGDTLGEICANILSDAPIALEPDDAVLPPRLRAIIRRCVSRDPERRYQSVEHLVVALTPLGSLDALFRGRTSGTFTRAIARELEHPSTDTIADRPASRSDARSSGAPERGRARERQTVRGASPSQARSSWLGIARGALLVIGVVVGLRLLLPFFNSGDSPATLATVPARVVPARNAPLRVAPSGTPDTPSDGQSPTPVTVAETVRLPSLTVAEHEPTAAGGSILDTEH
jgi:serine/threonine protein kinase